MEVKDFQKLGENSVFFFCCEKGVYFFLGDVWGGTLLGTHISPTQGMFEFEDDFH